MKHRIACACAFSLIACGGSALDVGSNAGGSSGSPGEPSEGGSALSGGSSTFGGVSGFGGTAGKGAKASGGTRAEGGGTAVTGGDASTGARVATGGTQSMGTAAAGGDAASGARAATGGAQSMGTAAASGDAASGARPATGGTASTGTLATGGKGTLTSGGTTSTGGVTNPLVPQTCGQSLTPGIWEGSTLDFFFNPLDDKWRVEINGTDSNGRVCGTATYLAAGQPAPPPATDPDAVYPPSFDPANGGKGPSGPYPGATYSIIQGAEVGGVLRFRISPNELWKDWCALQTPVPQGNGFGCITGDGGWSSDGVNCTVVNHDGTTVNYPFARCHLCGANPVCSCDATHCVASDDGTSIVFDLKNSGAQLTGTVDGQMISLDLVQ